MARSPIAHNEAVSSVVVHYGELALKGRNRPWFINTMVRSIRSALKGPGRRRGAGADWRIVVTLGPRADWAEIRERLARLPGISYFSQATHVPMDLEAIADAIVADLADHAPVPNFRILARRADKRFPIPSPDIERAIGARVQKATGWPVDLSNPAFVIRVEVLSRDAFYFFDRVAGTGGLPVGTGGKVMSLLSGGIDSPVAAWRLIRRGCRSHFVHFHSHPVLSRTSQDKVREVVRVLTRHQLRSRLFLVPFASIQQRVVITVPAAAARRDLSAPDAAHRGAPGDGNRCACARHRRLGRPGRVTDGRQPGRWSAAPRRCRSCGRWSDGQREITRDAQKIGTYETSIIPDEDCCTLFTPRFPATRATIEPTERAESGLDVASLVQQAVDAAELEDFRYPVLRLAASSPTTSAGDRT
jgi:thiamine biosynthesis protein ThiI